jgi:NAD(P) transhydrogenase subunit alpha
MIIGSVSENKDIEKRISITPELVKKYTSQGFKILIEKDYGTHLGFTNEKYQKEGCEINTRNYFIEKSDIILQLNLLDDSSLSLIKENKLLIGVFGSHQNNEKLTSLAKRKINVFSLELLPRITRAQSMDILSSQANLAGYKAVVDSFANFS